MKTSHSRDQLRSLYNICDASAHPLSERGGRRPGCVASSNGQKSGCVAPSNSQESRCVAPSNRQESGCVAPSNRQESGCVVLSNRQKSGCSAPAVEKGAVICLFFGCFYALTFCFSVRCFALVCADFAFVGVFPALFAGCFRALL